MYGKLALEKLVKDYNFNTVLDIGSGAGSQTRFFEKHNKAVRQVDIRTTGEDYINTDVGQHDCVWCCHVLEHQPNVNSFLRKISKDTVDNGVICITVPPRKDEIVGGHISIWNAGLLVYNLVMAGIDCSDVRIRTYGYNVSVIAKNKTFELPENLYSNENELSVLSEYLPDCIKHNKTGVISNYNWN